MSENLRTTPYGPVERDLVALATKRVDGAIFSVLQVAPTQQTAFLVALASMSVALGAAAGAFTAINPDMRDRSLFEVARVVIDLLEEQSKERSHG